MKSEYKYAPNCEHVCSGNCRREGCNCECGEFHGCYEGYCEECYLIEIGEKNMHNGVCDYPDKSWTNK